MNMSQTAPSVYPDSATPVNNPGEENNPSKEAKGKGSFCIPRAAYKALLDAKATAHEICAYLTLAMFTDETGMYSTASVSAVNRYTGANKTKIEKALVRLQEINATHITEVHNGLSGKKSEMVNKVQNRGAIVVERLDWEHCFGDNCYMPDGPTDRSIVRYVLPDFDEDRERRIWFGGNLVTGVGGFDKPLKRLKDAGDVAARVLLELYAKNDMESWGGVCPIGANNGPYRIYNRVIEDCTLSGSVSLIRSKMKSSITNGAMIKQEGQPYWDALKALESSGLIYEMVVVLNRDSIKKKYSDGDELETIPDDAEPLYELDCLSKHGYKPKGEEGLAGITARTAGDLGYSVANTEGSFNGTYAAFIREGFPAMIAGIFRLRFRVSNVKNAGVRSAWARIFEGNEEAKTLIGFIRSSRGLEKVT